MTDVTHHPAEGSAMRLEAPEPSPAANTAEPPTATAAAGPGRRRLRLALKLAGSALLLAWVLRGTRLADVWAAIRAARAAPLVLAFLLQFVGVWISARRWRVLLRAQGVEAPVRFLAASFMVGSFFNNFLPSTIGGDAVRIYDSHRAGVSRTAAVAVILVDRLLGLLVLMLFALAGLLLSPRLTADLPALGLWVALGTTALAGAVAVIFVPLPGLAPLARALAARLPAAGARLVAKVRDAFAAYRDAHRTLGVALAWSVALQANVVLFYVLVAQALGLPVAWANFLLIVSVALVVTLLPISINGIGLRENTFAVLLAPFGVASADALAFAWLAYLLLLGGSAIGGVVYAVRR
ncbi:MAG TPA: lysylphosphatidylglycerol synthase transmembrane domain-containing protein [Gemmatimonadales bacterium]|nr:lysylphosphatidylglycerol synthase transmembrane domain-containing protein [Gemmatimonadales bacterium]